MYQPGPHAWPTVPSGTPSPTYKFFPMYLYLRHVSISTFQLLQVTRGACNLNLQVVITYTSHVCNQHSFGLPLRMNGMHSSQFDHVYD